jgi:hypothetical protein
MISHIPTKYEWLFFVMGILFTLLTILGFLWLGGAL